MIEVFGTSNNNRDVRLANKMEGMDLNRDFDQNLDPRNMVAQGIELGFRNFLVPEVDYLGLSMSLEEALATSTELNVPAKSASSGH